MSYDDVIKNPNLQPLCWFSSPQNLKLISSDYKLLTYKYEYISKYNSDDFIINRKMQQWIDENLKRKPDRPKSLLLLGNSRLGKTEWARSLGKHVYWNTTHNLDKWDEDAEYVILDDFKWNYGKNENMTTRIDGWKGIIGCQKEIEMTDKYRHKRTLFGPKPCIILSNKDQNPLNAMRVDSSMKYDEREDLINLKNWFLDNVIVVNIEYKLYRENILGDDVSTTSEKRKYNDNDSDSDDSGTSSDNSKDSYNTKSYKKKRKIEKLLDLA